MVVYQLGQELKQLRQKPYAYGVGLQVQLLQVDVLLYELHELDELVEYVVQDKPCSFAGHHPLAGHHFATQAVQAEFGSYHESQTQ